MSGLLDRLLNPPAPPPAPPVPEFAEDVFDAPLASRVSGGYFQARFTARWFSGRYAPADERTHVRDALVRCARAVTERVSVAQIEATEITVNAGLQALAREEQVPVRHLSAVVRLGATAEARQVATQWETLQSQLELRRLTAHLELERLRHLRDDIFSKPDVARTYWLDRHPEAPDGALDDRFERIAEKLGSGPGPATLTVANLVRDFLNGLDAEQKMVLLGMLGQAFAAFDRPGLSERLPPDLT